MYFNELIQTEPKAAQAALMDMLQQKAFDYLDNYELELDEAVVPGSVKKDKAGHVLSFKTVPDKKSAVVPGSVKKDAKGNVLSFKTEDFEAMSQEEFDSIDEEQLDELSKATLASYVKKASLDAGNKKYASALSPNLDTSLEELRKSVNRSSNVARAVDKLVK